MTQIPSKAKSELFQLAKPHFATIEERSDGWYVEVDTDDSSVGAFLNDIPEGWVTTEQDISSPHKITLHIQPENYHKYAASNTDSQ